MKKPQGFQLRDLRRELSFGISIKIMFAVSASCILSLSLHIFWSFHQHQMLAQRTAEGFAHTIQSAVEQKDLISLRRTLQAFGITNPGAMICLRLEGNVDVGDVTCESSFKTYTIPLTGMSYSVAVDLPLQTGMNFAGVFFVLCSIVIAIYVMRLFKNLTTELSSDLNCLINLGSESDLRFNFKELHQAREQIEKGLQALVKVEKESREAEIGRLATQVAHDIRSPLTALGIILDGATLDPIRREVMKNAMSRIQHIANDLLERPRTTKSDNPKVDGAPTARVQICLSQILDSIVAEKQFQYSANSSLVFEFSSDSNVEREVPVNPEELKRALSNLLNNAAEACNFDGKIKIFVRHYTNEIVITVLDSGRGIPPEIMNQLGTRGFSHGKSGGSGFGLSHTKAFVEKAGGKLLIQSRVGEGTMISISLPSPRLFA